VDATGAENAPTLVTEAPNCVFAKLDTKEDWKVAGLILVTPLLTAEELEPGGTIIL